MKMKPLICYACGKPERSPDFYKWKAVPGRDTDWILLAIMPCCGEPAHTEPVATFSGYLHDAEANAKDAAHQHNLEDGKLRNLIVGAEIVHRICLVPILDSLGKKQDAMSTVRRHVIKRFTMALSHFAVPPKRSRRSSSRAAS